MEMPTITQGLDQEYKKQCLARISAVRLNLAEEVLAALSKMPSLKEGILSKAFYKIGNLTDPVDGGPLFVGVKTHMAPEYDVAYHNFFYTVGLPVCSFAGIVHYNGERLMITEDISHGGANQLFERDGLRDDNLEKLLTKAGVSNSDELSLEYEDYGRFLCNLGYLQDYCGSMDFIRAFILVKEPCNKGRWVATDLPNIQFLLPKELEGLLDIFVADVFQTPAYDIYV